LTYEGECKGIITKEAMGNSGFGYEPLFYYPEFEKTFAQLSIEEKGQVGHRGKALQEIAGEMDKIIDWIDINMPQFERVPCKGKK
jgi:XTP/dITP diphosphohydrolase